MSRSKGGAFVVLVGPDGVGKTSVASQLVARPEDRYFHFRPPILGRWTPPEAGRTTPKAVKSSRPLDSVARLVVAWVRFWSGHILRVWPAVRSGSLVVGDRWAYGYVAKPAELRYSGPRLLARGMVALLPRPALVVCLVAPVDVIRSRKQELTEEDIERDLGAWRSVPARRLVEVSSISSPEEIAERVRAALSQVNPSPPR